MKNQMGGDTVKYMARGSAGYYTWDVILIPGQGNKMALPWSQSPDCSVLAKRGE